LNDAFYWVDGRIAEQEGISVGYKSKEKKVPRQKVAKDGKGWNKLKGSAEEKKNEEQGSEIVSIASYTSAEGFG